MTEPPKHSVSVAGIVVDEQDRVLVIRRRDNGRWEPPGGVLELNEGPECGAVREIKEETGLSVTVDRLTGVYKNVDKAVVALVFRCTPIAGTPMTSDESSAVNWHTIEQVEREMFPAYSIRVKDAFGSGVYIRMHNGYSLL